MSTTEVETKLKPYVVRLEWASTISYVDVPVMANDPDTACQEAFENVDYDLQDNYDDGGETYVGGIVEQKTIEHAEQTCADRAMWDYMPGPDIPLQHRAEGDQLIAMQKIAQAMLTALNGLLEPCTCDLTPADWQRAIDAKAKAEAAGIMP